MTLLNRVRRLEATQQAHKPGQAFMIVRSYETEQEARERFERDNGYAAHERTPVLHIQRI